MAVTTARHLTSHTYEEAVVAAIGRDIRSRFQPAFVVLEKRLCAFLPDGA